MSSYSIEEIQQVCDACVGEWGTRTRGRSFDLSRCLQEQTAKFCPDLAGEDHKAFIAEVRGQVEAEIALQTMTEMARELSDRRNVGRRLPEFEREHPVAGTGLTQHAADPVPLQRAASWLRIKREPTLDKAEDGSDRAQREQDDSSGSKPEEGKE